MTQSEKDILIFKYVQLAIQKKQSKDGGIGETLREIRKKLGMSHKQIIKEAERKTVR